MIGSVKPPLKLKRRVLSSRQLNNHATQLGHQGESQATRFLVEKGYEILEQNVRVNKSEIDIIAFDPQHQELVFVEVKTRDIERYGSPSRAVNRSKLKSMQYVAAWYVRKSGRAEDYRFDILAVVPGTIHHYQNITWDL